MLKKVEDRLGRGIEFQFPPQRIISICPGITETLFALELEKEMKGRTRYCIFPEDKVQMVPKVGGTKQVNEDQIQQIKPDLIIAEKEENTKEIVEMLEKDFPVYVAEVQSISDAYQMIAEMGELTDRQRQAAELVSQIKTKFQSIPQLAGKRVAYVIWKKPYMVIGKNTYIQSVLETLGAINPFAELEGRYPAVNEEDFQKAELDYVFLASEPYPFKENHKQEFTAMMPGAKPLIVDGEMFWYGARMLEAADYFNQLVGSIMETEGSHSANLLD